MGARSRLSCALLVSMCVLPVYMAEEQQAAGVDYSPAASGVLTNFGASASPSPLVSLHGEGADTVPATPPTDYKDAHGDLQKVGDGVDDVVSATIKNEIEMTEVGLRERRKKIKQLKEKLMDGLDATINSKGKAANSSARSADVRGTNSSTLSADAQDTPSLKIEAPLITQTAGKVKASNDALKLAVQELSEMETEINTTEHILLKTKADVTNQKERMDELVEEKQLRDAADELMKKAEELEEGKTLKVDYETGRVTNTVNSVDGAEENVDESEDVGTGSETKSASTPETKSLLNMIKERFVKTKAEEVGGVQDLGTGNTTNDRIDQDMENNSTKVKPDEGVAEAEEVAQSSKNTLSDPENGASFPLSTTVATTQPRIGERPEHLSQLPANKEVKEDSLSVAEAKLAAVSEKKMGQSQVRTKNSHSTGKHTVNSNHLDKTAERVNKAIARAHRARRDHDPALIESETGLIVDMTQLMAAAAVGGVLVWFMRMPVILGFIAGGIFCGPSGFNLVNDIRRLQTLASLGSVFMMFALGVSFPVDKVLRLRGLVVMSTFVGQFGISVMAGYALKACGFAQSWSSAFAVSIGLSISSTSIAVNHINIYMNKKGRIAGEMHKGFGGDNTSTGLHRSIVLGMIACNELISAFILSVPEFIASESASTNDSGVLFVYSYRILWLSCTCVVVFLFIHREQGDLFAHGNSRVVVRIVSPLRNFFSFLYYATAGMALNPQFMIHNIYIICSFALLTSFLKATSFAVALKAFGASKQNAIA
eukprot:g1099.t1